jgi:PAS domain S-box-containing protein
MNLDPQAMAQCLFEESGDALFVFDAGSEQVLDVNPMVEQLTGFSRQEMLGMPFTNFFRSETPGAIRRLRQAFGQSGKFHAQEGFLLRNRMEPHWLPVSICLSRVHLQPKALGLLTVRDAREQRQAQLQARQRDEALRHSEARFRSIVQNSSDLVAILDAAGNVRYISPKVEEILGHKPEAWLGKSAFDFVHVEDREEIARVFTNRAGAPGPGVPREFRLVHTDGRWLQFEAVSNNLLDDPAIAGIVINARDITERKRSEQRLRESEAKYRSLTENLEQCIFLKDNQLRFVAGNKPFCAGVGRCEAELVGKTDLDLYPAQLAEKYQEDDYQVLRRGKRVEFEEQNMQQGKLRTVRVIKTPVRDAIGKIVGVLGIFWDVTEQRALEAQVRQVQKMEAVGQLAGGVAHDFNNLLTIILGNVSLMRAGLAPGHPDLELLVATERAAIRAAEMTSKLLGFSRRTPLRLEPANFNIVIEEMFMLLKRTIDPRIDVETRLAPDLWLVRADSSQMNQVLMNLSLNARDAMPDGGKLRLETSNVVLDESYAEFHLDGRAGEFVRLRVEDSGHGIRPEVRQKIFEPFFTTKDPGKGTGLGLAMVFGIIKQHQGWIDCYSELGQGTRFDLYLPRHTASHENAPQRPQPQSPIRGHETVLVVDDEPLIRTLGRNILQAYGYRVLLAVDGQNAVELYTSRKEKIDLVILDLTMPRLSGRDAFRRLIEYDPEVRVLFASGYSADHPFDQNDERVLGFVHKPFQPEELARMVRAGLDKRPGDGKAKSSHKETRRAAKCAGAS